MNNEYKHYAKENKERKEAMDKEMSEGKQDLWIHRNSAWGLKSRRNR